jgi:hypothetical protein
MLTNPHTQGTTARFEKLVAQDVRGQVIGRPYNAPHEPQSPRSGKNLATLRYGY